jgi:hypothetical protein
MLSKLASALRRWANRRNTKICFAISPVPLINGATHFMTKLITFAQSDPEGTSGLRRDSLKFGLGAPTAVVLLWNGPCGGQHACRSRPSPIRSVAGLSRRDSHTSFDPDPSRCHHVQLRYLFERAAIGHCAAQPKMQLHEDVDGIYSSGFMQVNRRAGPCSRICRQQPRGRADSRRHGKRLAMKHDRSRVSRWESSNRR